MPITKSAAKAWRQSQKKHAANLVFKKNFKNAIKGFRHEIGAKNMEKAKVLLSSVFQAVDKAVKKGVIKKNTASRYKSRLSRLLMVKAR